MTTNMSTMKPVNVMTHIDNDGDVKPIRIVYIREKGKPYNIEIDEIIAKKLYDSRVEYRFTCRTYIDNEKKDFDLVYHTKQNDWFVDTQVKYVI